MLDFRYRPLLVFIPAQSGKLQNKYINYTPNVERDFCDQIVKAITSPETALQTVKSRGALLVFILLVRTA